MWWDIFSFVFLLLDSSVPFYDSFTFSDPKEWFNFHVLLICTFGFLLLAFILISEIYAEKNACISNRFYLYFVRKLIYLDPLWSGQYSLGIFKNFFHPSKSLLRLTGRINFQEKRKVFLRFQKRASQMLSSFQYELFPLIFLNKQSAGQTYLEVSLK